MKISDIYGLIELNYNNVTKIIYNYKTKILILRKKNGTSLLIPNIQEKQFENIYSKVGDLYVFQIKKDK